MEIYVGNISYLVTEADLANVFGKFGKVDRVRIMHNTETGQNSGWAFVSMENEEEVTKAVDKLNLREFKGRKIKVNKYRKKKPKKAEFGEWVNFKG
ncbi:MAG: RNA-binding protein [Fibrobacteria bacterium]|nr:RNA-binding protein [Fibrobacteria bacterium]